jgi:hypothetical protein
MSNWMVVYGFKPEQESAEKGVIESDDNSIYVGEEKDVDDFFQEMLFDGTYPVLYKCQIVERAVSSGYDDEGCH